MSRKLSRRTMLKATSVAALILPGSDAATISGPRFEGKDTPKIVSKRDSVARHLRRAVLLAMKQSLPPHAGSGSSAWTM